MEAQESNSISGWSLLSQERQEIVSNLLMGVFDKFKKIGQVEPNKIYPIELTKGFDTEAPNQYVYIKGAFRIGGLEALQPTMIVKDLTTSQTVNAEPVKDNSVQFIADIIEVFNNPMDMGDANDSIQWIDHVQRIDKTKNKLYYNDNILNKEGEESTKESKLSQAKITSALIKEKGEKAKAFFDNMANSTMSFINKNYTFRADKKNTETGLTTIKKEEVINDPQPITPEELFDFYMEGIPVLTNEQYIDLFRAYAKSLLNNAMDGVIHQRYWDENTCFSNMVENLKMLQMNFSSCDFWNFSLEELLELGFVNWANKILLIPFWAFPIILINSIQKKLHTRDYEDYIIGEDTTDIIDFTNVYGCVIYGIPIADLRK